MFPREAIDCKYKNIAREYGIHLEIMYGSQFPQMQKVEKIGESYIIKLNADQIDQADYEEYLSYNVRTIILPRLRLETERLLIRPFEGSDAQEYLAFFSEQDARLDSGDIYNSMDEEYERLMEEFLTQTRYTLVEKETGHIVGTIHLMEAADRAVETMEIGYSISPAHRRREYAYESLSVLLRCLLYDLNLDMVIAGAFPDNVPSLELIKKLGFQYEGSKHKAFWNNLRGPMDLQYYYLEKP